MTDYEQYKKLLKSGILNCTDCRYFLGCECFSGLSCIDFTLKLNVHEKCVVCGEIIPEGRQVCPNCERG